MVRDLEDSNNIFDIVGIGSCLVDYIALVPKIIGPEEKVNGSHIHVEAGGPTINNLVQAARLGLRTTWIGKIGDDENGKIIQEMFSKECINDENTIIVPNGTSAFTWIPVDPDGQRCIYMFSNVTKTLTSSEVSQYFENTIKHSRTFHSEICQIPLEPIVTGMLLARSSGVRTIIDLDVDVKIFVEQTKLGDYSQLATVFALTDVLKASAKIALEMTHSSTFDQAAQKIFKMGPRLVVLTDGANGSYFFDENRSTYIPGYKVNVIDSTGAGDAFMGGLSYGLLMGWNNKEIGKFANACGAICCTRLGAQQSGNLNEIVDLMNQYRDN